MLEQYAGVADMPQRLQIGFVLTAKSRIKTAHADAYGGHKFGHRCTLVVFTPKYSMALACLAANSRVLIDFALNLSVPFITESANKKSIKSIAS